MLSQLRALWSAVWRCFQRSLVFGDKAHFPHAELAMPMCPRSWWNGGRQAPCSLVLMPSTSPLGPGTCQQWPTWDVRGANASNQPMSIDEHGGRCCILQLPSTSPPSHCRSVPGPNGLVESKYHVLWCGCLQPGHWGWNISAVTDMGQMFRGANATKQPIGAGNASSDQHVVDGVFCMWLQPMCPRSWWNGGRQAPCSLVLMPSTSHRGWNMSAVTNMEMFRGANVVFCSCGPAGHCWSVPGPNGLVEGKHHVLWCWCLQPGHWGLEHVSSDKYGVDVWWS